MAAAGDPDPGGGEPRKAPLSYADRLRTNVNYDQRLKRNVLEISVEKNEKDLEIYLDQDSVARVCKSIGMDIISEVEGYQVHYNGRNCTLKVWAYKGVNLERFCRVEGINVSKGVMTGMIRPAGRSDVTMSVIGLDFNTPDTLMMDYINKFGGVIISRSVIYSKYSEGPFKGKYNGEWKYQVEFSKQISRNMGTYHYLDGEKTRIFYRGNDKTCGRCHQTSRGCPGKGIARECQEAGGGRVNLYDHMRTLWQEIGFQPSSFKLPGSDDEASEGDKPIEENNTFARNLVKAAVTEEEEERYCGMTIANLNRDLDDEGILKFVKENISETIDIENVKINRDQRKTIATITSMLTG